MQAGAPAGTIASWVPKKHFETDGSAFDPVFQLVKETPLVSLWLTG